MKLSWLTVRSADRRSRNKVKRRRLILIASLMLISCASTSNAQRIVERLPNDQFIIEIDGKQYRALNAEKIAELAKQKIDLETCRKDNAELELQKTKLEHQKELLQKDIERFDIQLKSETANGKRNFELLMQQQEIARQALQFAPHGEVSG